jgi:micrococcal nuclease
VPRRFACLFLVLVPLIAVVASACAKPRSDRPATTPAGDAAVKVVRVVDGDTIVVLLAGHNERVRLIGIDTPESVKPNTPVQCFALEASARTKALLPPGSAVKLVRDVELRDRYGRLLAYVYRASDNLFVNLSLARDGYASAYTYPPNVAHAGDFVAAAAEARDAGRGLWSRCPSP